MLDHTHVIGQMSEDQKIRILTDIHSLAEPELAALGVPPVACGIAHTGCGGEYPSSAHLACSWDKILLADVSESLCSDLFRRGVNHVLLPGAAAGDNPFDDALSEDPYLAGELAGAYLTGTTLTGMSVSLDGYGMTAVGTDCVGELTAIRTRKSMLDAPYLRALKEGPGAGLVVRAGEPVTLEEEPAIILCRPARERETVKAIAEGRICISGSATGLQKALHQFRRLQADVQHGRATTGELEAACACGEAISEETLDAGVARLLSFAQACREAETRASHADFPQEDLAYRAALASTVLLENRNRPRGKQKTLPLTSPSKLCLVGDVEGLGSRALSGAMDALTAVGHTVVGHAVGYALQDDRNDDLLAAAMHLAEQADTVLLFLGTDAKREAGMKQSGKNCLPANQLALCDRLSRTDKTVIAVVSSRIRLDMSFVTSAVHPFSAVLLAPLDATDGLRSVVDILTGVQSPSGRLPVSLVARSACPDVFRESRRIGPFVGYRYYDTIGCNVPYPFGHGLTYTTFRYANLRADAEMVSFSVRNTGKRAGVEIVQVYLGLVDSAILRPRKELIGFARLELAPGQETLVTLPLEIPAVYVENRASVVEAGQYTLYVGSSASDIHLQTTLTLGQGTIPSDGEDPADYLPSASNIHSKRYVMEAEFTPMKPSYRNLLFGIAALCLAVSLKLYDIITASDAIFLNVVAGILAVGAAVCFAMEIRDRRKQNMVDRARWEEENQALFEGATLIPVASAAELFSAGQDGLGEDIGTDSATEEDDEYAMLADVDKTLTLSEAAQDLAVLAREKGLLLDESTVHSLFAALATSRLVMVRGMSEDQFSSLVALLGEYFSGATTVDRVDESYCGEADTLFMVDDTGLRTSRGATNVLLTARQERGSLHFAAFSQVDPATMSAYFVPFARHAHAPRGASVITAINTDGETVSFTLAENLWILVQIKEGASMHTLPDYITEVATVHTWKAERIAPTSEQNHFRRLSYGQMMYLSEQLRNRASIDEEIWKKVDGLEAYTARFGDFRMSNKLWLRLEQYMAVLISLGMPETDALDEAMAVKLLPALIPVLSGRIPRDERGLCETMDAIFGDGNTALCRKAVKDSEADLI